MAKHVKLAETSEVELAGISDIEAGFFHHDNVFPAPSNPCSRWCFYYVNELVERGVDHALQNEDVWRLRAEQTTKSLHASFQAAKRDETSPVVYVLLRWRE